MYKFVTFLERRLLGQQLKTLDNLNNVIRQTIIMHGYYLNELDGNVIDRFLEFCLQCLKHLLLSVYNVTKCQRNNIELQQGTQFVLNKDNSKLSIVIT